MGNHLKSLNFAYGFFNAEYAEDCAEKRREMQSLENLVGGLGFFLFFLLTSVLGLEAINN